jgi:hypothetical protein
MNRTASTLVVALILVLVLAAMWLGWRGRRRRDAALPAVPETLTAPGEFLLAAPALYVATTHAGRPLDRVAVAGLAFRGRTEVAVYGGGVQLAVTGERPVAIDRAQVRDVGLAMNTIDRVVEPGGLVRIGWRLGAGTDAVDVDSFLRLVDGDDRPAVLAALEAETNGDGSSVASEGGEA